MTSPPAFVARAHQVVWLTASLMKRTEPSRKPTLTPPGWFELALTSVAVLLMTPLLNPQDLWFGVMM